MEGGGAAVQTEEKVRKKKKNSSGRGEKRKVESPPPLNILAAKVVNAYASLGRGRRGNGHARAHERATMPCIPPLSSTSTSKLQQPQAPERKHAFLEL